VSLPSYHLYICFILLKIEVDIILTTRFSFKSRNIIQGSRFRKLSGTMSPPDDSKKAEILVEVSLYLLCGVCGERGRLIVAVMMNIDAVQKVDYTPIAITSWNVIFRNMLLF